MEKQILMQPNNIIKSKYDFTSVENKIFYRMLYNAQRQKKDNPLMQAVVTTAELKELIKRKEENTVKEINKRLAIFQQSILQFEYIEKDTGRKVLFSSGLITSFKHYPEEEYYVIELHEILYEHLTDALKLQSEGYSPINLSTLFQLKSAYAQRFYTLFRLWSRQNKTVKIQFTLQELRQYLKMDEDLYPLYKNFKQKVIKKAIEEINSINSMDVELVLEEKNGRKVEKLTFEVFDREPRKLYGYDKDIIVKKIDKQELINEFLKELNNATDAYKLYELLLKHSITTIEFKQIYDLEINYGFELLKLAITKLVIDIEKKDIKNILEFLENTLEQLKKEQAITTTEAPAPEAPREEINLDNIEKEVKKDRNFDVVMADITRNLKNNNIFIDTVEIAKLKEKYSEILLNNAVNILIKNNAEKKISNHLNYLNSILENIKNDSKANANKASNSNSSKPSNFNNFTQRGYDYNKLEKQLLGWASEEEYDEE